MGNHMILGVDPGIASTGVAVVTAKSNGYSLITAETLKTSARDATGKRLSFIHDEINDTLDAWKITSIAIERVFHNHNVTSSLTTGAVIGILQFIAHQRGLPIHQFTPQQVKAVTGLGTKVNKQQVLKIASRLFRTELKSHHEADAALCALCGCLQARTVVL